MKYCALCNEPVLHNATPGNLCERHLIDYRALAGLVTIIRNPGGHLEIRLPDNKTPTLPEWLATRVQ